jgi:hypothetical protein
MTTLRETYAGTYRTTRLPASVTVLREWSTETFQAYCACGDWNSRRLKITDANRAKLATAAWNHKKRCKL